MMTLFRPARCCRPSGLYLVKALALFTLFALSARPARAQSGYPIGYSGSGSGGSGSGGSSGSGYPGGYSGSGSGSPGSGSPGSGYPGSGSPSGGSGSGGSSGSSGLGWQAVPCNPDGSTPVTPSSSSGSGYSNGFRPLTGMQTGDASNTYPQAMKDAAKNSAYSALLDAFSPSDETQFPYSAAILSAQIFDGYVCPKTDGIGFPTPYSGTAAGNTMPLPLGVYYQSHSVGTYPKVDGAGNLVTDQNNIPLVGGSINGSVSADASGRLWGFYKVYYGYSSNYGSSGSVSPMTPPAGSPMPDHINLLLSTNVMAWAFAGKAAGASGKVTSLAVASIPFFGETLSLTADGDSPLDQPKRQIGGRHLVRSAVVPLDAMSGIATVYVDGEVHTQASNGVVYDQKRTMPYGSSGTYTFDTQNLASAGTWSFVTAGVKQDPREVWISCPTIEDSYYKGAYDSQHGSDSYRHLRDPGGAIQTDSVVKWYVADSTYSKGWQVHDIPFTANSPGFSNPQYQWSVAGEGRLATPYTYTTPLTDTAVFALSSADTASFPKSSIITATVTDGDGVVASNTFGVKWHLPYEPTLSLGDTLGSEVEDIRIEGIPSGLNRAVPLSAEKKIDLAPLFEGAAVIAGSTGNEEAAGLLELIGAIAKITSWVYDLLEEPAVTEGATNEGNQDGTPFGSGTWGVGGSLDAQFGSQTTANYNYVQHVPPQFFNQPDGWKHCTMSIKRVAYTTTSRWSGDSYNQHGYAGGDKLLETKVIRSDHDEPVFTPTVY